MVVISLSDDSTRVDLGLVLIRVGVETLSYSIHRGVITRHYTVHVAIL